MQTLHKWVPLIRKDRCTGCGLCVEACGPKCLEVVDGIAALTRPDLCGSEEHCIAPCQDDAIYMDWVPMKGDVTVGRWRREETMEKSKEVFQVSIAPDTCWGSNISEESGGEACQLCVEICPEVFEKTAPDCCASVRTGTDPTPYRTRVYQAARSCPVGAIRIRKAGET